MYFYICNYYYFFIIIITILNDKTLWYQFLCRFVSLRSIMSSKSLSFIPLAVYIPLSSYIHVFLGQIFALFFSPIGIHSQHYFDILFWFIIFKCPIYRNCWVSPNCKTVFLKLTIAVNLYFFVILNMMLTFTNPFLWIRLILILRLLKLKWIFYAW